MSDGVENPSEPGIRIFKRAPETGKSLGVLAGSFNPPTIAHIELMHRAADEFCLDEVLALTGAANADKSSYEAALEERLEMVMAACCDDSRASVGVSSHAFYVDMIEALALVYPGDTDLHFIIGFDTFERVLDPQDRYTARYHRRFESRRDALDYLFSRSRLIVATRDDARLSDIEPLLEGESDEVRGRVLRLDFPDHLASRSATEVRRKAREGASITGLVPPPVESYIIARGLYRQDA